MMTQKVFMLIIYLLTMMIGWHIKLLTVNSVKNNFIYVKIQYAGQIWNGALMLSPPMILHGVIMRRWRPVAQFYLSK